ncbi:MAG TPA: prolyl oligopeptidase family serine peptidase, partial [Planctomycetota bacterium]|nr:prolyl oligopeptidase family serine peptidase [Planctomycetota bacterium]
DPIGQGERWSYWDAATQRVTVAPSVQEHDHVGWQCLPTGENLTRFFLHDIMRGMDYMRTRAEIDPERIGITGNSGGGTQTSMAMLADPRFAAAAPGTFIMDRRSYQRAGGAQDAEQIWPGFTAAGFDHEDILLAMAPKPVRVLAVTYDFFPIDGTRRTVSRCKRLWELCGAGDRVDLVEDPTIHNYTPALARASAAFFSKHLLGREVAVDSSTVATLPAEKLWATKTGQVRGSYPQARGVHDELRDRLPQLARARAGKRAQGLAWLRERVHAGRVACEPVLKIYTWHAQEDLAVEGALWFSQPDLTVHGLLLRKGDHGGATQPVTIALWDGGTTRITAHLAWLRATCAAGRAVLVLNASGMGPGAPYGPTGHYGRLHKLTNDLHFLGDDLCALRIHDCVRAIDALATWPRIDLSDVRAYADGIEGIPLRLAALIEPRIRGIDVAGGPAGFADWINERHYDPRVIYGATLVGALAHFDLPEVEAAPAKAGKA